MIVLYALFLFLFSIYSYSLIDVNLTLFNNRYWEMFRQQLVTLGYFHRDLNTAIYLVSVVLFFFFSWYFVRHYKKVNLLLLTTVTGGILLFAYPFISHDIFSYMFDAKILTFYHKLPYFYIAQNFPHDPWLRFLHWTDRTYPYGPVFLWLTAIPSLLSMNKFVIGFFLFKLMSVAFYWLAVYVLVKMDRKWAVIFATQPLILIEGLINSHNDLIMVSLAIIGIYLLIRKKKNWWGKVYLLISAGIKYLTIPLLFLSPDNKRRNQLVFGAFLAIMIFISLTREIQPWYFLSFFAFLPFFSEWLTDFNFFSLGLLAGNAYYVRYGEMNQAWQIGQKTALIFAFFVLNAVYWFWKNKNKQLLLFTVFLAAVISRFIVLEQTAFFVNDQGRDMLVLFKMFTYHQWTLIGPATSIASDYGNLYFGPFYYYFLLPFISISRNPLLATMVFPALFVIGLLLFLRIKDTGFWEKIIFLILTTSSWYLLYYTRFMWNLNLAFLLSFILMGIFLNYRERILRSRWWTLIFGLFGGAIFQVHYGMLFLYAGLIVFFWKSKKYMPYYFLGFTVSFLPPVLFNWRHNGVIVKNLVSYISASHPAANWFTLPLIFGQMADFYFLPLVSGDTPLKIIIMLIVYGAIIFALWRKKNDINIFLLVAFFLFPLTFFFFRRNFDYYLACFAIWFYWGLAVLLAGFFSGKKIAGCVISFLLILFFIANFVRYFSLPENLLSLKIQNNMAVAINTYYDKWYVDERIKGHPRQKTNRVQIDVYPHQDDVEGIRYLLKWRYDLEVVDNAERRYIVCYRDACRTDRRFNGWEMKNYLVLPTGQSISEDNLIPLYDEKKDVKLYVIR